MYVYIYTVVGERKRKRKGGEDMAHMHDATGRQLTSKLFESKRTSKLRIEARTGSASDNALSAIINASKIDREFFYFL